MFLLGEQSIFKNSNSIVMTNAKEKQKTYTFALVLTILYPFGGLIYTLWHWREYWAKNTFWIICTYMGAVQVYWPEGTILGDGSDGGRYVLNLIEWNHIGYSLNQILSNYLIDQHFMDLYQQIVTYFLSCFTNNGHVLFSIFAFVFGYFYSRNIWYVLEKLPEYIPKHCIIIIALYFLVAPIYFINGVRMWTALHVYVYALMPYLIENKKNHLWCLFLTPFIHFSYFYIVIFALFYIFLPINIKTENKFFVLFSFVLFVITLFFSNINLDETADYLTEYSPQAYEYRIKSYVSQNVIEKRLSIERKINWYVTISPKILRWIINILMIIMFPIYTKIIKKNIYYGNLYIYSLLFSGLTNIMLLIPSGGRFQTVALMFKIPLMLFLITTYSLADKLNKCIKYIMPILLIPLIVQIRMIFDFYSITLLIGNFVTVLFFENNVPLIYYFKLII